MPKLALPASHVPPASASSRRGAVAVYAAIFLLLLIGFAGLMLDTARVLLTGQQLQKTADAAAMAGVPFLDDPDPDFPLIYRPARKAARDTGLANIAANAPVVLVPNQVNLPTGDIVVGYWDFSNKTFVPFVFPGTPPPIPPPTPTAIKILARKTVGSPNGPLPLMFGPIFGATQSEISRQAIAIRGALADPLVFVLDGGSTKGALKLTGNANFNIQAGAVQVNSSDASAIWFVGNAATMAAGKIQVVGNSSQSIPNLQPGSPYMADYLAGLPFPASPYTAMTPPTIPSGDGSYAPGYYPGGIEAGGGTITLQEGVFVFGYPGIDLNGNAIVVGPVGVTILLLKSDPLSSPGGDATIRTLGTSSLQILSPQGPFAGAYEGIAVYQQPGNTATISIAGTGAFDLGGVLYGPTGTLFLAGTSNYSIGGIDVWNMVVAGTGDVTGSGVPPGKGTQYVYLVE